MEALYAQFTAIVDYGREVHIEYTVDGRGITIYAVDGESLYTMPLARHVERMMYGWVKQHLNNAYGDKLYLSARMHVTAGVQPPRLKWLENLKSTRPIGAFLGVVK